MANLQLSLKNIKVMNGNTKKLTLSLKKQWFDLTKSGVKTEDYREINSYWFKRLFDCPKFYEFEDFINDLNDLGFQIAASTSMKKFDNNVMTLGYPKSTDTDRILKLEHKGIEIGCGNPEWGAEPNKLYFIIKHGAIL